MNFIIKLVICLTFLPVMGGAFAQSYQNLTTEVSASVISSNVDNHDFVLLDVRTPEEFAQGHIKNAQNLDYRNSNFAQELAKLDKNRIYLVYCRSGHRSSLASDQMMNLGFKKVSNMLGGINQWIAEKRPIEK